MQPCERIARLGDESRLLPLGRAQELDVGPVVFAEGVGHRECREHVSGGPAAPDDDLHRDALLAPAPAVPFAVAEPRAIAARTPTPASVTTSAEPPNDTSGSGTR